MEAPPKSARRGSSCARLTWPPSWAPASQSTPSWPRCAATAAAFIPAGPPPDATDTPRSETHFLGTRIRGLRKRRGLTLAELGAQSELTAGYISQLERNLAYPSIPALFNIARSLGVTIQWFFASEAAVDPADAGYVVRRNTRMSVHYEDGIIDELLTPQPSRQLEILHSRFPPGTYSQQSYSHEGEEAGYILSGIFELWLGDTMGELLFLYALADIAFVGGSLVPNGGHNLLEPAALGKPVFAGPHLFNFLDIAAQLRDAGALLEVTDAGELCDGLTRLWAQPEVATAMATAGEKVLRNNQGALERLLAGLARLLERGG